MSWFDPGEEIRQWIADVASSFITEGMKYTAKYISNPTDLHKVPFIDDLITGTQVIGTSLVLLFFYKRVMEAMKNMVSGEESPNWAEIFGSTAISAGLVNFTPWAIKTFLIPISNQVLAWIAKFPVNVHIPGDKVIDIFSPKASLEMAAIQILLMLLVWAIGIIGLGISSMIRYGHLALLVVAGPIIAASYTNRNEVLKTYWIEVISVVFTQCIHMLMLMLIIATIAKGSFEYLLMSFGFIVVAVTGPTAFKQILHSTGTKKGIGMVAQFAVYRTLMSGFKKK